MEAVDGLLQAGERLLRALHRRERDELVERIAIEANCHDAQFGGALLGVAA